MAIFSDLFRLIQSSSMMFLIGAMVQRLAFNFSAMLASWFSNALLTLLEVRHLKDFILIFALQFPNFVETLNDL